MATERKSVSPTRRDLRGNTPKTQAQADAQKLMEERVEQRLATITKNREERDNRTPQQQLDLLDKRLGVGQGAQRERARLQKLIEQGD